MEKSRKGKEDTFLLEGGSALGTGLVGELEGLSDALQAAGAVLAVPLVVVVSQSELLL